MKELSANWLTEGIMDVEYKKYVLLAYLQYVSRHFDEQKLYPPLADLIAHYRNLMALKQNKERASEQFPKKIKRIDFDNFRIEYERLMHDADYLEEIEAMLDFALPLLNRHLQDGKEIYDFVESQTDIQPVGIMPLNTDEGYVLVVNGDESEVHAFGYEITIFSSAEEKYRAIQTNYLSAFSRRFSNTFESIKQDLLYSYRQLPNPATFAISSRHTFPLYETLLPIAKRRLVRFLHEQGSAAS